MANTVRERVSNEVLALKARIGLKAARAQENKLQLVLGKLRVNEVDELVGDKNKEFEQIGQATMAWFGLLQSSRLFRQEPEQQEAVTRTLASSLVVLGTLIKCVYALGVRRGQAQARGQGTRRPSGAVRSRRKQSAVS